MPKRNATTHWEGDLQGGKGNVSLDSSNVGQYDVSFPKRAAEDADGVTSPEELIAAAHSACFAMQFSHLLAENGTTATALDVSAEVALGPDPAGGFAITGIELTVSGTVPGIDAETFRTLAEQAKDGCPVSKALKAVPMTVDATLS